jgi:NADH dehydrogenase FAD-containing subunit
VLTNKRVTAVDATSVSVGDERFEARTILWAAGVTASPLGASLGVPIDRAGRVDVAPDLTVPGHPRVFVVGDLARIVDPTTHANVPGVAPAAIQMAATLVTSSRAKRRQWRAGSRRKGAVRVPRQGTPRHDGAAARSPTSTDISSPDFPPGCCGPACTSPTSSASATACS